MLTRRQVVQGALVTGAAATGLGGYAFGYAPLHQRVTQYALTPPGWTAGLNVRLAILADPHFCEPWLGLARLATIVEQTNALRPDAILLLGDYEAGIGIQRMSRPVPTKAWAEGLAQLKAPLGVHAVLGNHDWWEDTAAQRAGKGPTRAHRALEAVGIKVYENTAMRLEKTNGGIKRPFWLCGLGDQWAFWQRSRKTNERGQRLQSFRGVDDLDGTLAQVTDTAPVVLMAHEPDIFPRVPKRVSLTLSGHTHGGQVRIFGYAPVVPSR